MTPTLPAVEIVSRHTPSGQEQVLCLRGSLEMAGSPVLRDAAAKFIAKGGSVLDMSGVEGVDVAAVQILVALDAEIKLCGRSFEVTGLPEAVERQWKAMGWCGFTRHD